MYTFREDENGNPVLIDPIGQEKCLYGEDVVYFWEDVNTIEESNDDSELKISNLIVNYYWDN